MPDDIGLALPTSERWLILQVHYWDVAAHTDVHDRSGVSMCTTTSLLGRKRALSFAGKLAKDRGRTRTLIGLLAAAEEEPALRREMAGHVDSLRKLVATLVDKPASDHDVDLALATLWGIGLLHLVIEDRTAAETDRLIARFAAHLEASRRGEA